MKNIYITGTYLSEWQTPGQRRRTESRYREGEVIALCNLRCELVEGTTLFDDCLTFLDVNEYLSL